ncbi:MAG: ABC transporter ATP-binding protein [Oscillospiraceae bacterium]|jgi:ABC-2 type transport system ATP-binding protein|nr:ABC transporter ATP-binding protein [Oscillospiraceae bacterium]
MEEISQGYDFPTFPNPLVEIKNLTKSYGSNVVLKNITFQLPRGTIVGLMGPNGSGKTSLMKILTGMINDYSGQVIIDGESIGAHTKAITAWLPDKTYLPQWMSAKQAINYMADFYTNFDKPKALDMLEKFKLKPDMRVKSMSKGMQEKLLLLLTMSRNAEFYVLDEPLGGVDPSGRQFIMDTILNNRPEDSTILLSTHMIYDMERVFDYALMIGDQRVLQYNTVDFFEAAGRDLNQLFQEVFPYVG